MERESERFSWVAHDERSCLKVSGEPTGRKVIFTHDGGELSFTRKEWKQLNSIVREIFAANPEAKTK